jgi:hypothetical protein
MKGIVNFQNYKRSSFQPGNPSQTNFGPSTSL